MALIRQAGTFTDRFGNDVAIATGDNADTFLGSGDAYVNVTDTRSISFIQLTVNGTVTNSNSINFDGVIVAANALVGQYFLNGGEAYRITANTASNITIDSNISLANDDTLQVGGSIYAINRTIRVGPSSVNAAGQTLDEWIQAGTSGTGTTPDPYVYANTEANFVPASFGALRQQSSANSIALGGRHIYFINCNIIFEVGSSLGPGTSVEAARAFSGHVGDGQASTTSINFVGCDATFEGATTTLQTVSTDWIDSNVRVTNQFATFNFVFNRNPGSRTENALLETLATTVQEWNFYGNPETLNDVVLSGFRLRTGSGSGDQTVLAPNLLFGNLTPNNFYSFNSGSSANPGFHHPGFTFIATATAPLALTSRASGQFTGNTFVVNHYGYDPTFYSSGLLTADSLIEAARVRMTSNANIVNRTGTNVSASIAASAKAQATINEFLTNTQGRMVSSRYSSDGGANFNPGYFDYTQSLNVGTAGATSFGDTQAGQSLADGVGIFPLQVWRAGTGFDTTNRTQVRSYAHEIDIDNATNISDYNVGDFIPIDTTNVVGGNLIGTRIKTTNVITDGHATKPFMGTGSQTAFVLPIESTSNTASDLSITDANGDTLDLGTFTVATASNVTTVTFTTAPAEDQYFAIVFPVSESENSALITFTGGTSTASLQDFANIARAVWYEYGFDPALYYGTDGSNLPAAGPFNETDWGLRPVISKSDPSGDSHATVIASGTGWSVRNHDSEGQLRISVWAPGGLAADTANDIAGNDPTRINSHNNGGTPLVGTVLNVPGGAINFQRIEDSTIKVDGGEIEIDPQRTSSADTFLRGTVSLEHTLWANPGTASNSGGWITNIPRIAGRDTLEDDWTIVSGKLRTDDQSGGGSGAENDPGIWDNSEWNNGTTTNQVRINKLTGNFSINGGSHAFQLETAPTASFTWTFSNVADGNLNIDLPTALPTGLVTIVTGATDVDQTQRDIVRAWLVAQVGASNFSEEPLAVNGGTPPTSGYWLLPAVIPAREYSIQPLSYTNAGRLEVINNTTKASIEIVNVTAGGTEAITFNSDAHPAGTEIAMLWKPYTHNTHTTIRVVALPDADASYDLADNTIVNEILAAFVDVSANVATPVLGSPAALAVAKNANSISANITGYDSSRADGATSQLVWRQVMASAAYALSVANLYKAGTIEINEYGTNALDYIRPTGTSTTGCDFRFFTITSNAVQRFTAVAHLDTTTEVEAISATVTGPLTDIGVNPAGIQSSEVVTAVTPIITETANTLSNEVDEGFDQMANWMDQGKLAKANKQPTGRTI